VGACGGAEGRMTEADFARIEARLGITLPKEYRHVMAVAGGELLDLSLDYRRGVDGLEAGFLTADPLFEFNLAERPKDAGTGYAFPDWWRTYVMVGTNGAGDYFCLRLDGGPGVWMIGSDCGDEPTLMYDTFQELVDRQRDWYREEMTRPELVVSVPC